MMAGLVWINALNQTLMLHVLAQCMFFGTPPTGTQVPSTVLSNKFLHNPCIGFQNDVDPSVVTQTDQELTGYSRQENF